jgi:hypothetical protein
MSSEARDRRPPAPAQSGRGSSAPPFSIPVFVVAVAAGIAGNLLAGAAGFGAVMVIALFGAFASALWFGGSPGAGERAGSRRAAQEELTRERERTVLSAQQLERTRRHAEIATLQFRDGKDPLTEVPELRVGPLHELLEAAREGAAMPVVNRLALSEAELVATDGEELPVPWPAEPDSQPSAVGIPVEAATGVPFDVETRAAMVREMDALISGLGELVTGLSASRVAAADGSARTPAQLVDAVVHTAADGIEDLAAGLMRANELAGVAERVTNKATLLALNAALEATRSGSEAFAAIAEETRRLAEFAREATDTISRLSSEIEYKVGETITAIHATSEDAKSAVATFQSSPGSPPIPTAAVEGLLRRAQQLKRRLVAEAA